MNGLLQFIGPGVCGSLPSSDETLAFTVLSLVWFPVWAPLYVSPSPNSEQEESLPLELSSLLGTRAQANSFSNDVPGGTASQKDTVSQFLQHDNCSAMVTQKYCYHRKPFGFLSTISLTTLASHQY